MVVKAPYAALAKDDSGRRSALVKFSTRLPVASHILLCLAVLGDERKFTSNLLADSVGVNPVVVRNVLGMLKSAGLVHVEPGVGGATLAKAPTDITLLDVFRAVEDEGELFRFHEHPNIQCPVGRNVHAVLGGKLDEADRAMEARLASVTLEDIADETRERMKAQDTQHAHGSCE